jgi:transcription termination factor Rho
VAGGEIPDHRFDIGVDRPRDPAELPAPGARRCPRAVPLAQPGRDVAPKKATTTDDGAPAFGAIAPSSSERAEKSETRRPARRRRARKPSSENGATDKGAEPKERAEKPAEAPANAEGGAQTEGGKRSRSRGRRRRWQDRRGRRKQKGEGGGQPRTQQAGGGEAGSRTGELQEVEGMLVIEHANHGHIRLRDNDWLHDKKKDVHVSPRTVQKNALRSGMLLKGKVRRGQGKHRFELAEIDTIDGRPPNETRNVRAFKSLTSIAPDFHYAVGDTTGDVSMKVMDVICPVGRGQRGLIVAPPRSGKTMLLQAFAKGIEETYPEVNLFVLLVDERPEEATEWKRTLTTGEVFVSTNDEPARRHVDLAEAVGHRCRRLVELGEDVIVLLDSMTRLGRAHNNVHGNSGKTMSGGIDSRALERPKQFFGAARNTETAGSLTILATALIETGSQMDRVIFEEFKGTGNMELVLSRKLADRRIFPAIDVEKSGTRKEEKLLSSTRLRRINTLRRVLARMHWAEAMELLITKLDDVERIDQFLERFDVDPDL